MQEPSTSETVEHLTSLEELDHSLVVVGIKAWLLLCFFAAVLIGSLFWAIFGTLPITVSGKCLVFDPHNTYEIRNPSAGVVEEIRFFGGEKVNKGDVIVVYENPASEITAPMDGEVLWVDLRRGSLANPSEIAVYFQGKGPIEDLRILGFLPIFSGQKVKVGMEVLTTIENANPEKYGLLCARISDIFPYPIGPEERYMQKIPSKALLNYLTDSGNIPTLLIIATPILDPSTPSQLKWTSKEGPPAMIFPGSIGNMQITLDNVKPISYVFPKKD